MEQQNTFTLQPSLAEVCDRFKHWRQTRKSRREPVPQQLWQAAVQLAGRYSINEISRALRLNYTDLKNYVHDRCCGEIKAEFYVYL
ncbi:MAG: hypothetical protein JRI63_14035 [Deltaproteobacteria bacterium]|nr:hypothetical protein [Deltaproteobacteria bacterium]MBW2015190.1 hypothetical protein [Deltaproteobacteria bacterium]MBW2088691.1 hypothetical protein [Deltaproteobacteria bacterium]